jgi:raffinose/stachyose/melibiose transport system substrate-binding protein
VTIVTAAEGTYEQTLTSEMAKSAAPTLFQVNGPVGLANWKDYCYDLSGSKLYGELTSDDFALKDGDRRRRHCLRHRDLRHHLQQGPAAEGRLHPGRHHQLRLAEEGRRRYPGPQVRKLGIKGAFTSAGMDSSSDWRFKTHLANLPIYYEYKADGINLHRRHQGHLS